MNYRDRDGWHISRPWKPSPVLRPLSKRAGHTTFVLFCPHQCAAISPDQSSVKPEHQYETISQAQSHTEQKSDAKKGQRWRWIRGLIDAVAAIGIVFVLVEIKLMNDSSKMDAIAQVYVQMVEIDKFFIEHPSVRPLIYGNMHWQNLHPYGDHAQKMEDKMIAMASAEMMMDYFG